MLYNIKFVEGDFFAIEGGVSVLIDPVAEDGHRAVAVEGQMLC